MGEACRLKRLFLGYHLRMWFKNEKIHGMSAIHFLILISIYFKGYNIYIITARPRIPYGIQLTLQQLRGLGIGGFKNIALLYAVIASSNLP